MRIRTDRTRLPRYALLLAVGALGLLAIGSGPRPIVPAAEAAPPAAPPEVLRDLVYARIGDRALHLDLHRTDAAAGRPPLVVWVHGGGWRRGSYRPCPLAWLTRAGYDIASVEYRLSTEATWPAQIHDVKGAVRWLRANAAEYGYDPDHVAAAGGSAGGHLVALLGTGGDVPVLEGDVGGNGGVSSRVEAVVDLYGPTDLTSMPPAVAASPTSPVALLLGVPPAERPELAREASPITWVTSDDAPFLMLHGTKDRVVPIDQSRRLLAALQAAGVPSTLVPIEGAGHGGRAFLGSKDVTDRILRFLDEVLRGRESEAASEGAAPVTPPADGQTVSNATLDVTRWASRGPFEVESTGDIRLHDDARKKDLVVRATWPKDGGSHPVIVWSHGAFGSENGYRPLVDHWASHGYVVLQPRHEDSGRIGRASLDSLFADTYVSRTKDVSFLLDRLDEVREDMAGYEGSFDTSRIGVGGHSFGAHTAQLIGGVRTRSAGAGGDVSYADPRPRSFLLISPQGRGGELGDDAWRELERPFLVVTGTNDQGRGGQPFLWRLDPFRYAPAREKFLVLVLGAHHGFGGITPGAFGPVLGPSDPSQVDLVKAVTLLFWDGTLRGDEADLARLRTANLEARGGARARTLAR